MYGVKTTRETKYKPRLSGSHKHTKQTPQHLKHNNYFYIANKFTGWPNDLEKALMLFMVTAGSGFYFHPQSLLIKYHRKINPPPSAGIIIAFPIQTGHENDI